MSKRPLKRPRINEQVADGLEALLDLSTTFPKETQERLEALLTFAENTLLWREMKEVLSPTTDENDEIFLAMREWVGASLRDTRLSASLTQEGLAKLIGIPRRTLRRYEAGIRLPSLPRTVKWCLACDAAPWVVFHGLEKVLEGERKELSRQRGSQKLYRIRKERAKEHAQGQACNEPQGTENMDESDL